MPRTTPLLRFYSMRICYVVLCFFLSSSICLKAQKAEVEQILQRVDLDSILFSVAQLTGIEPVSINGQPQHIYSRYQNQVPNEWAAIYLKDRLTQYGYAPQYQYFDARGQNVYAIKEGNVYPKKAFVICAHYDAIAFPYDQAVGADDNASGCAAVLEAARILKNENFPYTLIYIFFDEEEQGLVGSTAFNQQFDFDAYQIQAVFNLDMIAYDDNHDNKAGIHTRPYANSVELAEKIIGLNDTFQIGLDLSIYNPGTTASDHDAFWQTNKTAILLMEDEKDFNRYYHTKFDSMRYFHDSFFYKNTLFAIASLCWFASVKNNTLSADQIELTVLKIYPNPGKGIICIESEEAGLLSLYAMDGRKLKEVELNPGKNHLDLSEFAGPSALLLRFQSEQNRYQSNMLFLNP